MPMDKVRLKKIKESFTRGEDEESDRKRRMQLQGVEEPEMEMEDVGYGETEKEDAELPEDAPLKQKITRSIIRIMKKKGPPAK